MVALGPLRVHVAEQPHRINCQGFGLFLLDMGVQGLFGFFHTLIGYFNTVVFLV